VCGSRVKAPHTFSKSTADVSGSLTSRPDRFTRGERDCGSYSQGTIMGEFQRRSGPGIEERGSSPSGNRIPVLRLSSPLCSKHTIRTTEHLVLLRLKNELIMLFPQGR